MRLGICLEKRYKPITGVVDNATNTDRASCLAVSVVVLQHDDRLCPTGASMLDTASVKIAVAAVVATDRADAFLLAQQLNPKILPLSCGHHFFFLHLQEAN